MQSKETPRVPRIISPVLFLNEQGNPMCFYVRPGSAKCLLSPYIKAGGGVLSSVQKPGAILLIEPEESFCIPEHSVNCYVSSKYVRDCIEQNTQLDMKGYRLNPEGDKKQGDAPKQGRMAYTPAEDAAIFQYIGKHNVVHQLRGNRVWQDMEKAGVTNHTWQSMKAHFKKRLSDLEGAEHTEEKADKDEAATETLSSDEDGCPPPMNLSLSILTQSDPISVEITSLETEDAPAAGLEGKDEDVEMDTAAQPESVPDAIDVTHNSEPEPEREAELEAEPEPEPEPEPEAEPEPEPEPEEAPPRRRSTRQQMAAARQPSPASPSRPAAPQRLSPSPVKRLVVKRLAPDCVPPPQEAPDKRQRARPREVQERKGDDSSALEVDSVVQNGEASNLKKRKMGILESAAMEFLSEGDSESDSDAPLAQSPTAEQTEAPHTETQAAPPNEATEDTASESNAGHSPVPQEDAAEPLASPNDPPSEAGSPGPETAEPLPSVPSTSTAPHLFIFDNESQVPPAETQYEDMSLTEVQLEEDKQRLRDLMSQTKQDLTSVTKALLRMSGDFSAAKRLLLDTSKRSGPFWNQQDDALLTSGDPKSRQQLQEKYGEEETAKRVAFLQADF